MMQKTLPIYCYFDHEADVGIMAEGKTLEEAFTYGAHAMFELICDPGVEDTADYEISVFSDDLVSLWIDFLNRMLAEMDIRKVFFLSCKIQEIQKRGESYFLHAVAQGITKIETGVYKSEVKAATFCRASVEKTDEGYRVQCVLDI